MSTQKIIFFFYISFLLYYLILQPFSADKTPYEEYNSEGPVHYHCKPDSYCAPAHPGTEHYASEDSEYHH